MLLTFTILLLLLYLAKRISWWVRWVLLQQETALVNLVLLLLLLLACKYFILNFLIRIWHHACVNANGVLLMKLFALIIILIIDLPHLYICASLKWSMQGYFNYKNAITLWECKSPKYVNMRTVCSEYFTCLINQFTRA